MECKLEWSWYIYTISNFQFHFLNWRVVLDTFNSLKYKYIQKSKKKVEISKMSQEEGKKER